jgi:hypothetical protein
LVNRAIGTNANKAANAARADPMPPTEAGAQDPSRICNPASRQSPNLDDPECSGDGA